MPQGTSSPSAEGLSTPLNEVELLYWNRTERRWKKEGPYGNVQIKTLNNQTQVNYSGEGHYLIKLLWPHSMQPGERLRMEIKGMRSIELIDLEGDDANVHFRIPNRTELATVEILRYDDRVEFTCNGKRIDSRYMVGEARGDDARLLLVKKNLYPIISVEKDIEVQFNKVQLLPIQGR